MNNQVKEKLQKEIQDLRDRLHRAEVELLALNPDAVPGVGLDPPAMREIERQTQPSIQAQAALQESEERFRNAFDYARIGMALVHVDGRFMKVNQSLCQMIGNLNYSLPPFRRLPIPTM